MQNKYFKYLLLLAMVAFIIPQITLAVWWNPFSWNWNILNWFQHNQNAITITSLSPDYAILSSADLVVTVNGIGFQNNSYVGFNVPGTTGTNTNSFPATFISSTQLQFTIPARLLNSPTKYMVWISHPSNKQSSNSTPFVVTSTSATNQQSITVTFPNGGEVLAQGGTYMIQWNSSGLPSNDTLGIFLENIGYDKKNVISYYDIDKVPATTNSYSWTVPAGRSAKDVPIGNHYKIKIADENIAGLEGNSNSYFSISAQLTPIPNSSTKTKKQATAVNPNTKSPTITSISPTSATVGDKSLLGLFLYINGTNFTDESVVNFGDFPLKSRPATGSPITILDATIPDIYLKTAGAYDITVVNPDGGISNTVTFTVNSTKINPVPTITSIYPPSVIINSPDTFLSIDGADFTRDSIVKFNGATFPIINSAGERFGKPVNDSDYFVSNTININVPSQYFKVAGIYDVVVTNPAPGGGTSNTQKFTVKDLYPTITKIDQENYNEENGQALFITIAGTNFTEGSVISFNGSVKKSSSISFMDPNTLLLTFIAPDTLLPGTYNIKVTNPGGRISNTMTFTVK